MHKQISARKQNLIEYFCLTALRRAEVHFRCVLCGRRGVRCGPRGDHRVGAHRGDVGHFHQHHHELLKPLINGGGRVIARGKPSTMKNARGLATVRHEPNVARCSRGDFPYANQHEECANSTRMRCKWDRDSAQTRTKGIGGADAIVFTLHLLSLSFSR